MADTKQVLDAVTEAFNAHDEQGIRAQYADDAVFEGPGDVRLEDADSITAYAMVWLNAFPDAQLIVHTEAVAGEWAVQRFTFEGTHEDTLSGPAGDIPATHKQLKGRGAEVIRVVNGKITEDYLYYDQVQLLTQLGLMPEPARA
jgi:steroid delta-isomerase-like uncharacterized protein